MRNTARSEREILKHDIGFELTLVGEGKLHLVGAVDDMVVGDHQARAIDDDPRTEGALHLLAAAGPPRHAEKAAKDRIFKQWVADTDGLGRINIHDRGRHLLNNRREGVAELAGRWRNPAVLGQCVQRAREQPDEGGSGNSGQAEEHAITPFWRGQIYAHSRGN